MYLKDLKANCRNQADFIDGWRNLSRSDLCEKYLEYQDTDRQKASAYMGALLYSYWNVITYDYLHQSTAKLLSQEECYNLVVDSVLYVLDKKAWKNPKSSLFNDPRGPEKAINKVLDCRKINFFVATTRQKRKINYQSISLDQLNENLSDGYLVRQEANFHEPNLKLDKFVKESFINKQYLQAFTIDAIMHNNFQDTFIEDGKVFSKFNNGLLSSYLCNLNSDTCKIFSERYKVKYEDVLNSLKYVSKKKKSQVESEVKHTLKVLRHDEKFLKNIL